LALLLAFIATVDATGCTNPRVRREWRSLSETERGDWLAAVKCLGKTPHKPSLTPTFNTTVTQIPPVNASSSHYDDFVYIHMDLNQLIHYTGLFLPWHRAYVSDFEAAMRTECNYQGTWPYWDWRQDASPNFPNSTIFDGSPTSGFGGWGDPDDDYQISTGALADDFEIAYPVPHRIRRNYTVNFSYFPDFLGDGTPPPQEDLWNYFTPASQEALIKGYVGDFRGFQAHFESYNNGSHGAVHLTVGADLFGSCPQGLAPPVCVPGQKWSPNDPLFMMHHTMIDKIWYDWQHANPENFWSYFGGSVSSHSKPGLYAEFPTGAPPFLNLGTSMPTDGILKNTTIFQVMDTKNERLCYVYE